MASTKNGNSRRLYTIHEVRWAWQKGCLAGVLTSCGALVGIVQLLLSIKGLLQ